MESVFDSRPFPCAKRTSRSSTFLVFPPCERSRASVNNQATVLAPFLQGTTNDWPFTFTVILMFFIASKNSSQAYTYVYTSSTHICCVNWLCLFGFDWLLSARQTNNWFLTRFWPITERRWILSCPETETIVNKISACHFETDIVCGRIRNHQSAPTNLQPIK